MQHKGTQTIHTQRLVLRQLREQDAAALFENGSLGSTQQEARELVQNIIKYYKDADDYHWGIEYEGRMIGRIAVCEIAPRDRYMQLAYDIGPSYRNTGFMTEALRAIIAFLFRDVGVHRIYGQCRTHNIASARVMQKAGMIHEGRQRKHYIEADGSYSDVDIYGIISEDLDERS